MVGPTRSAFKSSADILPLVPFGAGGVDLFTNPALLGPQFLARGENIRLAQDVLARRPGAAKLMRFSDVGGSKTFGTTGKYATIPAADQLVIPAGGFAFHASVVTAWASAGNDAFVIGARPSGQNFHVFHITMNDAGNFGISFMDSTAVPRTVSTAVIANGTTANILAILDPISGTFTAYVNGAVSGTPVTGLATTVKPDQTANVVWAVGVEKQSGAAVTANSQYTGAIDSLTLVSLAGTRPALGTTTIAQMLLRHSARQWPTPQDQKVLFNYDMDAANLMLDSSSHQNHATLVGSPTNTAAVALSSLITNYVGSYDTPLGKRVNVIANAGRVFREVIRPEAA